MQSRELLTVREAAAYVHETEKRMRSRIRKGTVAAIRPEGAKGYLIEAAELDRVYASKFATPNSSKPRESPAARSERRFAEAGAR